MTPDEDSSSCSLLKQQELRMQQHKVDDDIYPLVQVHDEAGHVRMRRH